MPPPGAAEVTPQPPPLKEITVGETPVYIKTTLIPGQKVQNITIPRTSERSGEGLGSAILYKKEGDNYKAIQVDDVRGQLDWNAATHVGIVLEGQERKIPKDDFTLDNPESTQPPSRPTPVPEPTPGTFREVLSVIGLKGIREKARDLTEKYLRTEGGRWKNFFREQFTYQYTNYYEKLLKTSRNPLSDESLRVAENRAKEKYQEELKNRNPLRRAARKLIEGFKDRVGATTLVQEYALEEVVRMREAGEILEGEAFRNESLAINKRFETVVMEDAASMSNFIRKELGETMVALDPNNPEHQPILTGIRDIILQYQRGTIANEGAFHEATQHFVNGLDPNIRKKFFPQAELFSGSLHAFAERMRAEHNVALTAADIDARLADMEIRLGAASMGEVTSLEPSATEKAVKRIAQTVDLLNTKMFERTAAGRIAKPIVVNPVVVGTAVSAAISLKMIPQSVASSTTRVVLGAAGGGVVAGMFARHRELGKRRLDFSWFLRQREAGVVPNDRMSGWYERFGITLRSADELVSAIRSPLYEPDGTTIRPDLTPDHLRSALANLADAKARQQLGAERRIGLIMLGHKGQQEQNRTMLATTVDKAERDLRQYFASGGANAEAQAILSQQPFDEYVRTLTETQVRVLNQGNEAISNASDPVKNALGTLMSFTPEADIVKRRFGLGEEKPTGKKAQGLENVLAEFKRAAKVEATRRGIIAGTTGVAAGALVQEILMDGIHLIQTGQLEGRGAIAQALNALTRATREGLDLHTAIDTIPGVPVEPGEAIPGEILPRHEVPLSGLRHIVDASGVRHPITAAIPDGTRLVPIHTGTGGFTDGFNLVDSNNSVLLHGVDFDADGHITNLEDLQLQAEAARNGITFPDELHRTITVETGGTTGTFDKLVGEMGNERGFHGPWGWVEDPILADGSGVAHGVPATNLAKNLFRGTYENYYDLSTNPDGYVEGTFAWDEVGHKVDYNAMRADVVFHQVPNALFTDGQLVKLGQLMDEAINQHETLGVAFDDMDQIHRLAYEIGRVGRVATKEEVALFLEHFGGVPTSLTLHQAQIVQQIFPTIGVGEILVTGPEDQLPIPIIPVRISRMPKTLREIPEIAYYYLSEPSPELVKIFEERRSRTLAENPKTELNDYKEVETYLQKLDPSYRTEIERMAQQLGPMNVSTKLTICMPVAGHQEGSSIYDSLKNYTYQTANKQDYEIVLFVNQPDVDREGKPVRSDKTMEEIERFQRDFPDMPVRVMKKKFPSDQAKIGRIRRHLGDATLVRHHARGPSIEPLIIVSNDADNKGIAPTYIQNFIDKFQHNPSVDGYLGQLDWDPESYIKNPYVHIGTRLFQYLNIFGRLRSGGMVSSGANFAYRSNIYAAIGGYIDALPGGEDIAIGQAIIAARGTKERIQFAGLRVSRLYTSSRRTLTALREGLAPIEQWNRGFSAYDDEIRKLKLTDEKQIRFETPEEQERFLRNLEHIINRTIDTYEAGERLGKGTRMYRSALGKLGIKYEVVDGRIHITDGSRLLSDLKRYKKEGMILFDVKSGRKPSSELQKLVSEQSETSEDLRAALSPLPEGTFLFEQEKLEEEVASSPTLATNPDVVLEATKETKSYLERQPTKYMNQLRSLNEQIGDQMDPNAEIAVCIPVAGPQEMENIYGTLKSYSQQTLDPSKFEVLLFVNAPTRFAESKKTDIERTFAEIDRAKRDFPGLKMRVATAILLDDQVRIGNIRKILTDLAVLRSQDAGINRDLLLLSNDADNEGIAEQYLEQYLTYFTTHPDKEGAVGNLQFDPKAFIRLPALHAKTEFVCRLDKQGFINGNIDLYGNNSVMKSSIYCALGGYPTSLKTGEQEWTGNTIRKLRKKRTTLGYAGDGTLLVTTLRRQVLTYLEQKPIQIAFGDAEAESRMRALNIDALPIFDYSDPVAVKRLQDEITGMLDETIRAYEQGDLLGKDSWFYKTNLEAMGIKYRVEGDPKDINSKIVVTDISRFIERQKKIRELIERGETNMANVSETIARDLSLPEYMREYDPSLTPEERKAVLDELLPPDLETDQEKIAWLAGHNKSVALATFIQATRERLLREGQRDWRNNPNWEKKWLNDHEMSEIADRYSIPMAFMIRGNHALVLTKPPLKNPDRSYTIAHYNPFDDGEQTINIHPSPSTNIEDLIYVSRTASQDLAPASGNYDSIAQALTAINYDLSIPTIPGKEWLSKAKMALTQVDGYNCTLWDIWHAATAWAMQPGENRFKREGLAKFSDEMGVRLITYEDVRAGQPETPPTAPAPPPAPPPEETKPVAAQLPETINQELSRAATDTTRVDVAAHDLMTYVKSINFPGGGRITSGEAKVQGDRLVIENIKVNNPFLGTITFSASFTSDPTLGLVLNPWMLQLNLSILAEPFRGKIEKVFQNFLPTVKGFINAQLIPDWETTNLTIEGNNIGIHFKKKSPPQPSPIASPPHTT